MGLMLVHLWLARLGLILALSFSAAGAGAAERLQVSPWFDGGIAAGTVGVWVGINQAAPAPALLEAPASGRPGGIDGWARYRVHDEWLGPSDALVWSTIAAGGALTLLDSWRDENVVAHAVIFAEAMLINAMVTDSAKALALRPRPYTYSEPDGSRFDVRSFFSGHTSHAATASFVAARLFDLSGDLTTWERIAVYGGATALTASVGAARVAGGMHFPTDVLVGGLVGASIGVGVPELHRPGGLVFGGSATPDGGAQLSLAGGF